MPAAAYFPCLYLYYGEVQVTLDSKASIDNAMRKFPPRVDHEETRRRRCGGEEEE